MVCLLGLLIGSQTAARSGDFGGFVASTKPAVRQTRDTWVSIDGYVSFWNGVPVNNDAVSFLALTRFFHGQVAPAHTGIYDRRAAYAWALSLGAPLLGHYWGAVALNGAAWLVAALTMGLLAGRLLGSPLAAWCAGIVTATSLGFSFMVGTPVSTSWAFASVAVVLAFLGWCDWGQPPFRWRDALHAGWLIGVVSWVYPVALPLLIAAVLLGLRRVPFRLLGGLSLVAVGLLALWPAYGSLLGLQFNTTNSGLLTTSLLGWWERLAAGPVAFISQLRTVPIAGVFYAAFPGVLWPLSGYGYLVASPRVRRWSAIVGGCLLLSAAVFANTFGIPRSAYLAWPVTTVLTAAAVSHLARTCGVWHHRLLPVVASGLLLLAAAPSLAPLLGWPAFDDDFHYWIPSWGKE